MIAVFHIQTARDLKQHLVKKYYNLRKETEWRAIFTLSLAIIN